MRTRGFAVSGAEKLLNKLNALGKGKRVTETIPNPDPIQTNMPFIRANSAERSKGSVNQNKYHQSMALGTLRESVE